MGKYTSDELFHFVGRLAPDEHERNYDTLRQVIRQGCISHRPHEAGWGATSLTIEWDRSLVSEELVVPTVTCFCDIPFEQLAIHVTKYGCFGISFDRSMLVKYGGRPVSYVPLSPEDWGGPFGATLLKDVECVFRAFRRLVVDAPNKKPSSSRSLGREPTTSDDAVDALNSIFGKDFLAFIKPFDSTLAPDHAHNFYMEREWRKFGNLCFKPADVRRVVVERSFLERARQDLPDLADVVYPAPGS